MNRTGRIRTPLDTVLNEVGFRQAIALAKSLEETKFDYAVSSDLERALSVRNLLSTFYLSHTDRIRLLDMPRK